MILRDNVYGTMSEDVWRRDFTINALYYNIADFSIVDYLGGFADLKAKRIRMIGDPAKRMREDPVRMLRAVRFACKLQCELPKELTQPMTELKALINHVSSARMFEEIMKMFHSGVAFSVYEHLIKHDLFVELFPATAECLKKSAYPTHKLLSIVFQNTDERIKQEKTVTPSFIVAALLWHPICMRAEVYLNEKMAFFPARMQAIEDIIQQQTKRISIPKRITQGAREIWLLQMRMMKRFPKRVHQLMEEPKFRAAFDFLECRAMAGEKVSEAAKWWKDFLEGDPINQVQRAIHALGQFEQSTLIRASKLYQTPPLGDIKQNDFINAVVKMETALSASSLLSALLDLEQAHGRVRKERWGPRTLDCDLLLYGQHFIDIEGLTVPHPEMTKRAFVLEPLLEIAPDLVHPNGTPFQNYLMGVL
jgi:poly(A) polymerase